MNLTKLDIKKISQEDPSLILIIGKRGTGKTTLAHSIIKNQQSDIALGTDFCDTPCVVCNDGDTELITKLCKLQAKKIYDYCHNVSYLVPKNLHINLLFDEMICDKNFFNKPEIRYLMFYNRRLYIRVIITVSYVFDIPDWLRGNIDYSFYFYDSVVKNQKEIWTHFWGCFYPNSRPSFEEFQNVFGNYTKNHGCIVHDNTKPSNERMMFYNADISNTLASRVLHFLGFQSSALQDLDPDLKLINLKDYLLVIEVLDSKDLPHFFQTNE